MDKQEIKDRLSKLRARLSNLYEKYPFVFTTVLVGGLLIGFVVGKIF